MLLPDLVFLTKENEGKLLEEAQTLAENS